MKIRQRPPSPQTKRDREQLYQLSLQFIQERAPSGDSSHGWRDTLKDIEQEYGYKPAYDVALILARTLYLSQMARPRTEDVEAMETEKRRQARLRRLLDKAKAEMAEKDPVASGIFVVEGPRADWQFLEPQGKLADWHLDEFAGHVGVILGETRWTQAPEENLDTDADPYRQAFSCGVELLRTTAVLPREINGRKIHISKQEDDLRERFWRLRQAGGLPPPPNDANPLGWAEAIDGHLQRQLWDRKHRKQRIFVTPEDASCIPIRVDTWFLCPGPKLEWRGPRWLHPDVQTKYARLKQLCRVLPKDLHPAAFVAVEAMEILRPWLSGTDLEKILKKIHGQGIQKELPADRDVSSDPPK